MGKAFSEIVADRRLVNEMELVALILLPFVRVSVKVVPRMPPVPMPHKVDAIIDNAVPVLMIFTWLA